MILKKIFFILFIFLLALPLISAENFDNLKDLTVDFDLRGDLALSGQGADLDFLETTLKLIPVGDERQDLLIFSLYSDPLAEIDKNTETIYTWNELSAQYFYGFDSRVRIFNHFSKIRSKIPFPNTFDPSFDIYI